MSASLLVPFNHASLRWSTRILLLLGTGQLLLFLLTAAHNFYRGSHIIVLKVHVGRELYKAHPHLFTTLSTSAGSYGSGTQGDLLYQPTSFGNCLLFHTIGEATILSVVFIFLLSLYLHVAVSKLQPGREFSQAFSRAFSLIGLATLLMHMAEVAFSLHLGQLFKAQTHHQFYLATHGTNPLYVVFGSLLLLCAPFFKLGNQLQQDAELTI